MVDTRHGSLETIVTIEQLISDTGAVYEGHIVYASGRHGQLYIEKTALYPDPVKLGELLKQLARKTHNDKRLLKKPDCVVVPAVAGTALGYGSAMHLNQFDPDNRVLWCFADKDPAGNFFFRDPFKTVVDGSSVLIVDDIATTGGSFAKLAELVRTTGGELIAGAALVNRGKVTAEAAGVPSLIALLDLNFESWAVGECPQCQKGVAINTEHGHGRKYLSLIARADRGEILTADELKFIGRVAA